MPPRMRDGPTDDSGRLSADLMPQIVLADAGRGGFRILLPQWRVSSGLGDAIGRQAVIRSGRDA
jgi:hypothetical protein